MPNSARVPILAPIGSANICPLGSKERWELRALPFGCNASTLTVLSVIVSVLGTVAAIGAGFGMVYLAKGIQRRWKETDRQGWAWTGGLENKLPFSLARVFGKGHQRHDDHGGILGEEARDNDETRPLLA